MEKLKKIGTLNITVILRVSCRGKGLYLYLPKDVVAACDLQAGDMIECRLGTHMRRKIMEEGE